MNPSNVLIEISHLKKYYPVSNVFFTNRGLSVKAVDDVSFQVKEKQSLGIVGESGCGKSTMGKTILRLIEPTGGNVIFEGKELFNVEENRFMKTKELSSMRKEMAMIFQDPYSSLNPHMTIGEAVKAGVVRHQIVPKEEVISYCMDVLCACGLEKEAYDSYPNEFSGGQRQRAVIARALALKPKVVVCDEPTAALDVSIQSQVLNTMLDMQEQMGLTYLFISHNLQVTRAFCDEIAVMYLGKIVEKGPSDEVYFHGCHPYTKALIASLPISEPGQIKEERKMVNSIPSMVNIPSGCRFHTRCPYATEKCKTEEPVLREVGNNHFAACHYPIGS